MLMKYPQLWRCVVLLHYERHPSKNFFAALLTAAPPLFVQACEDEGDDDKMKTTGVSDACFEAAIREKQIGGSGASA